MGTNKPQPNPDPHGPKPTAPPPPPPKKSTKAKIKGGQRVTPVTEQPASQRVEAPDCPSCRSSNTNVYATRRPLRYAKCVRCGWTWSFAISKPAPGGHASPSS